MAAAHRRAPRVVDTRHDSLVLVLQGGGALGAYQAGVYEGMAEVGLAPDWVTGVSIGAINAALIAGNPPQRRVERLRAFWERVSSGALPFPVPQVDALRAFWNGANAARFATFGVPGFFRPRMPPPLLAVPGTDAALSFYDTTPLQHTLEELVDFELIAQRKVRVSLGAVHVRTGNSVYFDNHDASHGPIRADHVRASGALPPAFAPVDIDGEPYWDGGIVSNTPLWYVLDDSPRMNALVVQVDLFSARGAMPTTLDQVLERKKDIQYSSKTRFNTRRVRDLGEMRAALERLLEKLPPSLRKDADVRRLGALCDTGRITIAHLINRRLSHAAQSKDYEFSRATIEELWAAGLEDVRRSVANIATMKARKIGDGIQVFDLTLERDR